MSKKAPFKEGVSVSFQLSKVCHTTFMENGPCKKSFGKKKRGGQGRSVDLHVLNQSMEGTVEIFLAYIVSY